MKARLVTGIGVVSAIGVGRTAFLDAMRAEELQAPASGEIIDLTSYPGARVAEVRGFDATRYLGDKGLRSLDRLTKLLVVATRLALHDAGFKKDGAWTEPGDAGPAWPDRVGLVVSNAYGSLEAINELDRVAVLEDRRYINPARFPLTVSNTAAGYASIWEDLRALNVSVSDGNCGGLDAVACADMFLEQQRADALVVGGAEAMSEALFLAFRRLGAGACLGEGAALVVLETPAAARSRKAHTLAEVVGYGTSFMAPDRERALVQAEPRALERAIANALADAGVTPQEVDVVVSGVSGLRRFDDAEFGAIQAALGHRVCVLAPKLVLGETLGAGGAMGILVALALFREAASARASALARPVRGSLRGEGGGVRTAVVTSIGYYGNASALVMRAASS